MTLPPIEFPWRGIGGRACARFAEVLLLELLGVIGLFGRLGRSGLGLLSGLPRLERVELLLLVGLELAVVVGLENDGDAGVVGSVELPAGAVAGDDDAVESAVTGELAEQDAEVAGLDGLAGADLDQL